MDSGTKLRIANLSLVAYLELLGYAPAGPEARGGRIYFSYGATPGWRGRSRTTPMQIHPVEVWDLLRLLGLPGQWQQDQDSDKGCFLHIWQQAGVLFR